ncbi:MAG TPA: DUF427 domain-containing protein [Methylomirabilota bacterium]|nr:DUF427 domain-containing protein [Methylomirabilota bacterium]
MARTQVANPSITIAPNPNRVVVRLGGEIIADSTRALVMRAPGAPDVQYIPREDVDMGKLTRTTHATYCQYKGDASYWSIRSGPRTVENAVWSYESPYEQVAAIKGHLAFYSDRIDAIEELPAGTPR